MDSAVQAALGLQLHVVALHRDAAVSTHALPALESLMQPGATRSARTLALQHHAHIINAPDVGNEERMVGLGIAFCAALDRVVRSGTTLYSILHCETWPPGITSCTVLKSKPGTVPPVQCSVLC